MSEYLIEFEKIVTLESKGSLFLGDTSATFLLKVANIINEKDLFGQLSANGYARDTEERYEKTIDSLYEQIKLLKEENNSLKEYKFMYDQLCK